MKVTYSQGRLKKNGVVSNSGTSSSNGSQPIGDAFDPLGSQTNLPEFIGKERVAEVAKQRQAESQARDQIYNSFKTNAPKVNFKEDLAQKERTAIGNFSQTAEANRKQREQEASTFNQVESELSFGDKISNSAKNMVTSLKMFSPAMNVASTDIWEAVLGKELVRSEYEMEGRDFDQVRSEAFQKMADLKSQMLPTTAGISDNIKHLNASGLVVNLADALGSIVSTGVPAILTGGGSTIPQMVGQSIIDYNDTKAKSKGISVDELYKSGQAELKTPVLIGTLAGTLELVGLKSVKNLAKGAIKGEGYKKLALYALETNKEGMTEILQGGLDAVGKVKAENGSDEEATKAFFNHLTSKEGLNEYLMGVMASGGAGAIGHITSNITDVEAKKKVNQSITEIQSLEGDLANENVSPEAKAVIADNIKTKVADISKVIDDSDKKTETLSDEDKQKTETLNAKKEQLEIAVADPNISEGGKLAIQSELESVDSELAKIKPSEKVKQEKATEYFNEYETAVKEAKTVDEALSQVTKNGAKLSDTFNRKYNPDGTLTEKETFQKFYDEKKNIEKIAVELKKVIPENEVFAMAASTLPKEGTIFYKDMKTYNYPTRFERYLNNPQNLDKEIGSSYKIYEFLKKGGKLPDNRILLDNDNNILDGHNRLKAQLALGKTDFEYSKSNDDFLNKSNYKTIAEAYYDAKINGTNSKFLKKIEDLLQNENKPTEPVQATPAIEDVQKETILPSKEDAEIITPKLYGYEDIDAMTNEKEIADNLYQEITEPTELSPIEQAIRNAGGFTTTEGSFNRFGDRNGMNDQTAKSYIRKNGQSLDVIAQELSKDGLEVTPQDLVDYISKFNDGNSTYSGRAKALQNKLQDLTGKKYNKFTVKEYIDKVNESARKAFTDETVTLSPEEITLLNSNEITLDNIHAISEKLDFLYDKETFDNIKEYLKNENGKTNSGTTDVSGTEPSQTGKESAGVEKQPATETRKTESERLTKAKENLKSAKDEFSDFIKKSRGNLNSGFNPADFIVKASKLIKAYAEVGIVKLSDVLSEMRKDYGDEFVDEHLDNITKAHSNATKENTGINQENIEKTRDQLGLEEIVRIRKADEELNRQADKWVEDGKSIPDLVNSLEKGGLPTDVENVVLRRYISSLEARNNKTPSPELLADINKATKVVYNARRELGRALRAGVGEVAVVDNLSNFLLEEMDALGVESIPQSMIDQLKAKYEKGQSAKEAYEEGYEKAKQEFIKQQAEAELNKQKGKSKNNRPNVKKTDADYRTERKSIIDSIRQKLKQARGQANAVPVPYLAELIAISPDVAKLVKSYVEQGVSKLDDLVKKIKSDLEDAIPDITDNDVRDLIAGEYRTKRPTKSDLLAEIRELKQQAILLKKIEDLENGKMPSSESAQQIRTQEIDALKKRVKELEDESGITDIKGNEAKRKQIDKRMQQLQDDVDLENYDSENPVPRKLKLDSETQKKQDEYIAFLRETNKRRDNARYEQMSIGRKAWEKLQQFLGLRRIIQTSLDFSMPFRQAITVTLNPRYVKPTLQSFANMFKSTFSEKQYSRIMFNIENDPLYNDMRADKLQFADVDSKDNLKRDEDFRTSFLYQIPYLREPFLASNRAAAGYINTARYELYVKGVERLKSAGIKRETSPEQYESMANWVMNLTGRGKLLEFMEDSPKAQRVLGDTFYGARLMASRFNLLNPNTYIKMPKEQRIEALKDMSAYASVAAITLIGMSAAGATVSLDPDDPDFLKARWGTKRYDFTTGGMSVYLRFFFKLAKAAYVNTHAQFTGEDKKKAQKYGAHALKNSVNFFRYKLAPNTSYVISGLSGTDALGKEFNPYEILQFWPMYTTDLIDAFKKDEGAISPFTVLMPNMFGIGTQDYDNGKKEKKDSTIGGRR